MPQADTLHVNPESPIKLQVVAFEQECTLLPAKTGDGSACFVQEGEVRNWLVLDAPGPSQVLYKVQVPNDLYQAVVTAFSARAPKLP